MKFLDLDAERDANYIGFMVKNDTFLPYDTGRLKRYTRTSTKSYYKSKEIKVELNGQRVPYAGFLEMGTKPHDIPHAFGYGSIYPDRPNPYTGKIPFGVGGRFDNKFHPGSVKHKGFVEYVMLYNCLKYYNTMYDVAKIEPETIMGDCIMGRWLKQ